MSEPHGFKRKLKDYSTASSESTSRSNDSKKKKKSNGERPGGPTDPSTPVPTLTAVVDPVVLKTQFDALNSALETLLTTISSAALPSESFLTKEQDAFLNTLSGMHHGGGLPWLPRPKISTPTSLPPTTKDVKLSANQHHHFKSGLPPLPIIRNPRIHQQVFTHSSAIDTHSVSTVGASQLHMERLELLGDSYLHMILTRILYDQMYLLREGNLTAMRNILESNATLAAFSNAYGLPAQLKMGKSAWNNKKSGKHQDIKKLDADLFEAYIGGLILDADSEAEGIKTVKDWLELLFDDKLKGFRDSTRTATVDSQAKHELYKKLIWYPMSKATVRYQQVGGGGGNKGGYVIDCVFSGYNLGEVVLGRGEGGNKNEAIARAAMAALANTKEVERVIVAGQVMFPRPAKLKPQEEKDKMDES